MVESSLNIDSLVGLTNQGRVDKATHEAEQKAEERNRKRREARARKKRIAEKISKTVEQDIPHIDRQIELEAKTSKQTYQKTYEVKHLYDVGHPVYPAMHLPEEQIAEETDVITGVIDKLIETYTLAGLGAVALKPEHLVKPVYEDGYLIGEDLKSIKYGVEISWVE